MNEEVVPMNEPALESVVDPSANGHPAPIERKYDESSIKHLEDAAHIRLRPGMYIGDTGTKGLHHLVYELVYNSVDEALAGYCKVITTKVDVDGSVMVSDDGRGIPVEKHPEAGISTLEMVMTKLKAGGKFSQEGGYRVAVGLHGIGAKAVNALSEWTRVEVRRNGKTYVQEYERGKATTEVREVGAATHTGTTISFKPDPLMFKDATFDYDTLLMRLRELAFLNKGLHLNLVDVRANPIKKESFQYEGGIAEFVAYLNRDEDTILHPPIYVDKTINEIRVEVALQYNDSSEERVRCYANNGHNPDGGTHLSGLRRALTTTIKAYGTKHKLFKADLEPEGVDFREGLTAVVSVQLPDAELESQTKVKLNSPAVEGAVANVVSENLARYLEENPKEADKIIKKVSLAAEARIAAAKARDDTIKRKKLLSKSGLPGKLMDCTTKDRGESELFLVEGQSAGGTAESGRNREFQAVLPLRGKVINVEKARPEKMLANQEISNLISALGVDIGNEADLEKLRYGKIIILTDADVDGQHIRTLLLTFFYRQMPQLVAKGHIYVARPPLFKVTDKKHVDYVHNADAMLHMLMKRGLQNTRLLIHPLPVEGVETPAPRTIEGDELISLVNEMTALDNALQLLERRGVNLALLVGRHTEQGLPSHRVVLSGHEEWFHTNEEVDAYRKAQQELLGRELVVADESETNGTTLANAIQIHDLHEIRTINRHLNNLRRHSLGATDLIPQLRIAGREPPLRFQLEHGENKKILAQLRELVIEVRRAGEKGIAITRFKGLGEMDDSELNETTLDPEKRTVLQVQLDDALKADLLFRTLMGEKVEPRRDFIYDHALDVKDIDYHGA